MVATREDLSYRQAKMLAFIKLYIDEYDYPPANRDIQEACDISSTSVVAYNLQALQRRGGGPEADGVAHRGADVVRRSEQERDAARAVDEGVLGAGTARVRERRNLRARKVRGGGDLEARLREQPGTARGPRASVCGLIPHDAEVRRREATGGEGEERWGARVREE